MAIVRELVTRLKFDFIKKDLLDFEKGIFGAKTRVLLATGGITAAIAGTLAAFSHVATSTRDIVELARNTGIATEDFISLREAASNLGLDRTQFDQVFSSLATQIDQAKRGFGALFELERKSLGNANLFEFVNNSDTAGTFKALLAYVRTINDVQTQIRILSDHFGSGNANALLRLVNTSPEELEKLTENYKDYAAQVIKTQAIQEDYLKNLDKLGTSFNNLKQSFINFSFPVINTAVDFANKGFEGLSILQNKANAEGTSSTLNFLGEAVADLAYKALNAAGFTSFETLNDAQKRIAAEDIYFKNKLQEGAAANNKIPDITMTNDINISVPPGPSSEHYQAIATTITDTFNFLWNKVVRELINNNPQTQ